MKTRSVKSYYFRTAAPVALAAVMWSGHAFAQVRTFDIPAEEASRAIPEFARQAGIEIFAPAEKLRGVRTPAIHGAYDVREAFSVLLNGSGLVVASDDGKTITLRDQPPAGAMRPPILKVAATDMQVAQASSSTQSNQSAQASVEEVVVTGSRIVRDGYQAPTPVSVMSSDDLNAIAANNIADSVNRLPEFAASVTPHNSSTSISSGTAGVNNLNLRGLGPTRTLVLLDGQRVVGSTLTGFNNNGSAVDVNVFPDGLVSRVDVETGGASATYGSDALAGVVNFVLDHNFTGVKGEVEGGVTTYGDDRNWRVSLTAGTGFANDRGHFLISGDASYNAGISGNPRPWQANDVIAIGNPAYTPTNGQPSLITKPNVSVSVAANGGLIIDGPLRGIAFGPGGTPYQFQFGADNGFEMYGGSWQAARIDNLPDLDLQMARQTFFSRASYDITDDLEVYAQLQWAYAHTIVHSVPDFDLGGTTIYAGNPFIPASVAQAMTTMGITSFDFGNTNADLPHLGASNVRTFRRHVFGADGKLDLFGSTWNWDAYYGESTTHMSPRSPNDLVEPYYTLATDAVRAPNGAIVCRSNLTGGNPACVPFNVFGNGVNSQAAINYVQAEGYEDTLLRQDAAAVTARGEPMSDWAGPISLALGAEYRYESVTGFASALDEANAFLAGNYHASHGHYNVSEGFLETVVPLAKDVSWARSLDLSAAARFTDYSTSGYVTTWKIGATYAPIDDVKFRATRSRDIRAPNLGDLFSAGQSGTGTVLDPSNGVTTTINSPVQGNPNLKPEVADTTGLGVVVAPSFIPGFNASFDYYNIDISGAISSLSAQQYVDRCYAGDTTLCGFIQRTNGLISFITIEPANVLSQNTHGFDIEADYKLPLSSLNASWDGSLTFRGFGTYVFSLKTIDVQSIQEGAGVNFDGITVPFAPRFRYTASLTYNLDPITATLTARGISGGVYDHTYIACASGCPANATATTIDNNSIASVTYLDLSFNYKIAEKNELFFVVENFTNKAPPLVAGTDNSGGFYAGQGNATLYDRIGRMFRAGVRFRM